ncbi:MAG TPA: lysylphosphatidylglycerol synthase transmembrane domain-containing protein [Thermomicrobiales bacterium]|nr:lysylphosphatidylglycerol synthase transmembrane domain-containing protein [Thermomicrobiales bacterium]
MPPLTPTATTDGGTPYLMPPADTPGPVPGESRPDERLTADVQVTLRRRVLSPQTLISFGIALAILWFVVRRLDVDPGAIWAQIRRANLWLLAVAFILWYGAFFVRGRRWGYMLGSAGFNPAQGFRLPTTPGLAEIVILAYFANSIVPAKLGDAYRGYLLKRESDVPLSAGFGTILAERFVDAMMLVVVLAGAALVVFGTEMPDQARPALLLGALLIVVGLFGLVMLWLTRNSLVRFLPSRLREAYARLHGAIFGALRRPALVLGIGVLLWLNDGMRVWFVARSLDAGISLSVAILVAVMGALLTVIPFTPAGLGVVELGVGSVLVGVLGVDPVVAGSIILLDRVVAYWSLLAVGAALYLRRTRREYRDLASSTPPA